jgi:hypothetical protein
MCPSLLAGATLSLVRMELLWSLRLKDEAFVEAQAGACALQARNNQ